MILKQPALGYLIPQTHREGSDTYVLGLPSNAAGQQVHPGDAGRGTRPKILSQVCEHPEEIRGALSRAGDRVGWQGDPRNVEDLHAGLSRHVRHLPTTELVRTQAVPIVAGQPCLPQDAYAIARNIPYSHILVVERAGRTDSEPTQEPARSVAHLRGAVSSPAADRDTAFDISGRSRRARERVASCYCEGKDARGIPPERLSKGLGGLHALARTRISERQDPTDKSHEERGHTPRMVQEALGRTDSAIPSAQTDAVEVDVGERGADRDSCEDRGARGHEGHSTLHRGERDTHEGHARPLQSSPKSSGQRLASREGGREGIRTLDHLLRRQVPYPD